MRADKRKRSKKQKAESYKKRTSKQAETKKAGRLLQREKDWAQRLNHKKGSTLQQVQARNCVQILASTNT